MSALSGPFGNPNPATPNGDDRLVSTHSVSRRPFCIGRPVDALVTPIGNTAVWLMTRSSAGAVVGRLVPSGYATPGTGLGSGGSTMAWSEYVANGPTHSGVV